MKKFFTKHRYPLGVLGILGLINIPILSLLFFFSYAAENNSDGISLSAIFTAHYNLTLTPNLIILVGSIIGYIVLKVKRNKETKF